MFNFRNDRLKTLRKGTGVTRPGFTYELYKKTGLKISATALGKWEKGSEPSSIKLACVAKFFDKPIEFFMTEKKGE